MDKIAAEAAHKFILGVINAPETFTESVLTAAIESALSQSLAARDKEIGELAQKWQQEARDMAISKPLAKYFASQLIGATRAQLNGCASELLALLKGKAI